MNKLLYTDEIYHIFNRTINKEAAFSDNLQIRAFINRANYYQSIRSLRYSFYKRLLLAKKTQDIPEGSSFPLVEIYAYSIMPNHYHFLLKQLQKDGIRKFITNTQNSFAKSYNIVEQRTGGLFERAFKYNHISNDNELKIVSRYIHLNPVVANLVDMDYLSRYPYTSYKTYANPNSHDSLVNRSLLLKKFGSFNEYSKFVYNNIDYIKTLHEVKLHTSTYTPVRCS